MGRRQTRPRRRARRGWARTWTAGRVSASRALVSLRGPARPAPGRSFTKKLSRPAPSSTHRSRAPAATRLPAVYDSVLGSTPGWAQERAAATAPSPRGHGPRPPRANGPASRGARAGPARHVPAVPRAAAASHTTPPPRTRRARLARLRACPDRASARTRRAPAP